MRTRETASAHGAAAHGAPPGHLGSPRSKATTVRPQLTGGVARRLRRGARRSGGQRREKRNGCIKICLLNSSFFLTQTVTFQKNENWEMVRKWWVSRQIIRSKISKCRILGLKPSVFEINCHLGLTPSVFKKNFRRSTPPGDPAGVSRWLGQSGAAIFSLGRRGRPAIGGIQEAIFEEKSSGFFFYTKTKKEGFS